MLPNNENKKEINTGNGFIDIKSAIIVKLNETFIVQTDEGSVELNVSISADLNEIEPKYHEILLNVLSAKYLNRVSFGDNPFSQCLNNKKRKWYQFWKNKLK
jgi:hypothetical protein